METGPLAPLAQAIGAVTVRVGDRLLPLFFVSPERIHAQLPSDLTLGDYTLVVRWEGHPDQKTSFSVVRNAPGLFTQPSGDVLYALAAHEDGSAITPDSPARAGEAVAVFGTGFGPYTGMPPDGFPVPDSLALTLVDPVQVLAGDTVLDPISAGAAPGQIGLVAVRFRIPDTVAAAVELRVRVNQKESNRVVLPIQ
jgi:uncharacterized protein (TIGR03437 family)